MPAFGTFSALRQVKCREGVVALTNVQSSAVAANAASSWLALRAGVLRRAVSSSGAALMRSVTSSNLAAARSHCPLAFWFSPPRATVPKHEAQIPSSAPSGSLAVARCNRTAQFKIHRLFGAAAATIPPSAALTSFHAHPLPANHSLNRTLHSRPSFSPPFHSGLNAVLLFRAG